MEHKAPIGRAYVDRCGGWRCIYSARRLPRGKKKGWQEVRYIDLREGQCTYVKAIVEDYRTMEGEVVNDREEESGKI